MATKDYPGKCRVCGKKKRRVHRNQITGKMTCISCTNRERGQDATRYKLCSGCGFDKLIWLRLDIDGVIELFCLSCYQKSYRRKESCFGCGQTRVVARRLPDGKPLCDTCYRPSRRRKRKRAKHKPQSK